jgi:hypothetical protein
MEQSRVVWQHLCAINNGDISRYSWNLIAQLEAESPATILDDFVKRHWDSISHQPPPARFDWHAVFDEMAGEPAPPASGQGIITVPRSDFAGRTPRDAGASQPRYSILARLTGGQLPLLQVDLPTVLTPFLLGRAVHYQGVAYRVDVTGGSGMKPGRKTVEEAFAQAGGPAAMPANTTGKLYALRVSDTGPGTAFARLMEQLFPYTEAYYYFQRALMSSPPAIAAAHGPAAHVLEGRFRIGVLPDRATDQHPFQLQDAAGRPLALQPHDGLGFIRESVARRFAWYQGLTGPDSEAFGGSQRQANLPPDALQHYARDERAAAELAGLLPRQGLDSVQLYRRLTQGMHGKGHIAKAVPASGGQVVLPGRKRCDRHLLLGRAPYETAKLQAVPDADVLRGEDATARYLDASPWLQYSFVCRREDQSLSFFKGGLLVVPDAQWPKQYADRHLVFSAEDEKSRSGWRDGKARHRQDAAFDGAAMLAITEAFGPGSCVAVPLPLQKAMGGDYDGDDVLLVSGMPALHGLVQGHDQQHVAPELKLPKTHTPAYGEHGYYLGRSAQIAATRLNVLGRFTVLQRRLLALPEPAQHRLAREVLATLCREGLDSKLEAAIEALLDAPDRQHADAQGQAAALASELERRAEGSHGEAARGWFHSLAVEVRAWAGHSIDTVDTVGAVDTETMEPLRQLASLQDLPADPAQRLALWLEHLPWAGPLLPEAVWQAHQREDDLHGMRSLLMLGIKAGEDAYKSDTGVRTYDRIGRKLEGLLGQQGISAVVPYTRHTMHLLLQKRFDGGTARQFQAVLAQAPNQAAAVMGNMLGQWLAGETGQRGLAAASAEAPSGKSESASASGRKRGHEEEQERRVRPRTGGGKGMPDTETPRRLGGKRPREEEQERRVRPRTDGLAGQASAAVDGTMGTGRAPVNEVSTPASAEDVLAAGARQ